MRLSVLLDALRSRNHKLFYKVLIDSPELLNAVDEFGKTPLIVAASCGFKDIGRLLIDAGANVNIKDKVGGRSALMWATWSGYTEFVKLLVDPMFAEEISQLDLMDSFDGKTALMYAASSGHIDVLRLLIDAGAGLDIQQETDGRTALIIAVLAGHIEIIRALLAAGADINIRDTIERRTPVLWAASIGSLDALRVLVEAGANLALTDKWGYSVLHYAVRDFPLVLAQYLINSRKLGSDLDLNLQCSNGVTPLHFACLHREGGSSIAVSLILHGADPWLVGGYGKSSFDIALNIPASGGTGTDTDTYSDSLSEAISCAWKKRVCLIISISKASGENVYKKLYKEYHDVWRYMLSFM